MELKDAIRVGSLEIRFRVHAAQTASSMTMFEFSVPAGSRVPVPHSHDAFDETVYGLNGVGTWTLDGQKTRIGAGDVLFIPRPPDVEKLKKIMRKHGLRPAPPAP